jgi:rRNA-processing protein EBP2
MAKNKQNKKSKTKSTKKAVIQKVVVEEEENESTENEIEKLTLETLDAISDGEEGGEMDENEEWNAEARALRQAIADGSFDNLGKTSKSSKKEQEQSMELDDNSSANEEEDEEEEEEETEEERASIELEKSKTQIKALQTVTMELTTATSRLPWPERYDITPDTPLPFGKKDEEGNVIHIHDDLKREVIFYNTALEAVHAGRQQFEDLKIPCTRPEDYFAEMVKTDGTYAYLLLLRGFITLFWYMYTRIYRL